MRHRPIAGDATLRARPSRRPNGDPDIRRVGVPRDGWLDIYYYVLVQPWSTFYLLLISLYAVTNCIFATLYWTHPGCIAQPHPGDWLEDFFFSVETIATVGYGVMHPETLYGHWVVAAEIMFGVLSVPLATGLTILKIARPTARVTFSRNVLVAPYDGVPTLMFRLANLRSSQIFETRIIVTLLRRETTAEGRVMRRLVDLKLVRDTNPMFILTWLVMHRLDEASPLFGIDLAGMDAGEMELTAIMTGLDSTTSSTVHARHIYQMEDIIPDRHFEDIVLADPSGRYSIDYSKLHAVEPLPGTQTTLPTPR